MSDHLRLRTGAGRWTIAATILGSGAVFLEGSVVTVAMPAIGRAFNLGIDGLQWVMNGYLLTLSSLMLLGGALGDVYSRRRVFCWGAFGFAAASLLAAVAPTIELLVAFRLLQGVAGAMLVPNSLAVLEVAFVPEDRAVAIGRWAGWSAISTAVGPLLGGWLVDSVSWRWVFAGVVFFALAAAVIAMRKIPEPIRTRGERRVDYAGAGLATIGLGGIVAALISAPDAGFSSIGVLVGLVGGSAMMGAFILVERSVPDPLLPLSVFRSRQFTGTNVSTLLIYGALSGVFFFLVLQLQNVVGYSALAAGASLLPINVLLLLLSPRVGRLSQRIGARWPMVTGSVLMAFGIALFGRIDVGARYVAEVLPAAGVFGLGLSLIVAPLTAAVLASVPERQTGLASGVNNAVARLAGLMATATLPLAAGIGGLDELAGPDFSRGFTSAMWICAALCIVAAAVAAIMVRARPVANS